MQPTEGWLGKGAHLAFLLLSPALPCSPLPHNGAHLKGAAPRLDNPTELSPVKCRHKTSHLTFLSGLQLNLQLSPSLLVFINLNMIVIKAKNVSIATILCFLNVLESNQDNTSQLMLFSMIIYIV